MRDEQEFLEMTAVRADAVQGVPFLYRPTARQCARHVSGHCVQPLAGVAKFPAREQGKYLCVSCRTEYCGRAAAQAEPPPLHCAAFRRNGLHSC